MMLYEEGHFLLTDPVSNYLEDFKSLKVIKNAEDGIQGEAFPLQDEITILQLLTHTAGFSHGLGSSNFDQQVWKKLFEEEYPDISTRVQRFLEIPLLNRPGERWNYSAATDVVSVLIEKFSGMTTGEFLTQRIFMPLGMDDTGYNIPASKQSRIVKLHGLDENNKLTKLEYQPASTENTVFTGINGLFSTPKDYMAFCTMLLNYGEYNGHRILSRKTVELMTKNHINELSVAPGIGFGLGFAVVNNIAESGIIGSEDSYYWIGAFRTYFIIDPSEELVAILMTQVWPYGDYYGHKMRQFIYQAIID